MCVSEPDPAFSRLPRPSVLRDAARSAELARESLRSATKFGGLSSLRDSTKLVGLATLQERFESAGLTAERVRDMSKLSERAGVRDSVLRAEKLAQAHIRDARFADQTARAERFEWLERSQRAMAAKNRINESLREASTRKIRREAELYAATIQTPDELRELNERVVGLNGRVDGLNARVDGLLASARAQAIANRFVVSLAGASVALAVLTIVLR